MMEGLVRISSLANVRGPPTVSARSPWQFVLGSLSVGNSEFALIGATALLLAGLASYDMAAPRKD